MTTQASSVNGPVAVAGTRVVAHFQDGRVVKGATQDFTPNRSSIHLFQSDGDGTAIEIQVAELKAIFFVKSYEGDPKHEDAYDFEQVRGHGRKTVVTFEDGETIEGYTMGYHPQKPGFFLVPAEEQGNNTRIFVVNAAVREMRDPS